MTTFVLPRRNEVDLDDLPKELHEELTFILADTMDDVLDAAMPDEFTTRRRLHVESTVAAPDIRRKPVTLAG